MKTRKKASKPAGPRRPTVALVSLALDEAAHDAIEAHRQAGVPLAVWRDGRTVLVSADKIESSRNGTKTRRKKP